MKIKEMSSYLPFINTDKGLSSHLFRHKIKLSLLFLFPLLISISGALFQIDKLSTRASQLVNLERLTKITVEISHLLHDLQKERDYASVYIASYSGQFRAELLEQRKLVKISKEHIHNLLTLKDLKADSKFDTRLSDFSKHLAEFEQVRLQVDELAINETKAIERYNQLNHELIYVVSAIVQLTVDSELTQAFSAYTLFLKGKESAGIERSKFSAIFARGYFLASEYNELIKLKLEQELFFHEFEDLASDDLRQSFTALSNEQVFQFVQQIKNNALVNNNIRINVTDWLDATVKTSDKLGLLGDRISVELIANASRLKRDSEQERLYWLIALMCLYIITCGSGIWLIVHIHRSESNKIKEYQGLFSESSAAMVVVDAKSQRILYGNNSFSKLVGYNQKQLAKLNVTRLHRKRDYAHILHIFNSMVPGEISVTEKVLFIRNDDKVFYADIFAFPITIDKQEYLAAHIVDITSKLQAKKYIQQSEQTLHMILNSINSAVVVLEGENHVPVYMNNNAIEIYQNRKENESVWSLFEQKFFSNMNDDFANHSIVKNQYFNKSKQRWFQITSQIIDWSDGRVVCLKMLKDITESYDAERRNNILLTENRHLLYRNYLLVEQERKHIAKELHDELGQLLTGIKLQADFISRQLDEKHENLQGSAQNIVQATSELIKSTRNITNNLRPIILDQLGVIDAIKELVQNWRNLNKDIQFELDTESLPHQISDEFQISIYRIVQEAITNACKHADAHHIEISIKFISSPQNKDNFSLQLKIQDDGKGFVEGCEHSSGVGIINMRERTEALNGIFCLMNKQKQGAGIFITIPLEPILQEAL